MVLGIQQLLLGCEGAPELEAANVRRLGFTKDAQEIGQQFGSYQFPTNQMQGSRASQPLADVKPNI